MRWSIHTDPLMVLRANLHLEDTIQGIAYKTYAMLNLANLQ